MKKVIYLVFVALLFTTNVTAKSTKDLVQEIMKMQQKIKDEKIKQAKLEQKQKEAKAKTKAIKKLGQTVDKVADKLGIN